MVTNAGTASRLAYDVDEKIGEHINHRYPQGIIEDEDAARVTNTNFLGGYYVAKYLTPILIATSNPSSSKAYIVISSMCSHLTDSAFVSTTYNVSKAALNRLVEHIQNEHAKDRILAFAMNPGGVLTSQNKGLSEAEAAKRSQCE